VQAGAALSLRHRPLAPHDPALKTLLAPALDCYRAIGRKAARTRAEKKGDA